MWWTDDEQATKNSLCRAVSGGPVYVSDKFGRTRAEVLKPVMFRDGRIPRCDISATPTADCLLHDPTDTKAPFKIRNLVGENGIIAVYNISKDNCAVSGTVCPEDAGLQPGKYVYYEYFSGKCGVLEENEKLAISLADNDTLQLYTFRPAKQVNAMGRADLFVGIKAVTTQDGNTYRFYEGGELIFISQQPLRITNAGKEIPCVREGLLTKVSCAPEITELTVQAL